MKRILGILLAAALPAALAQTGTGTVRGTVVDPSRAALPGAKVTLTSEATSVSREAQSNEAGIYYFASIPPGRYRLAVEAAGFKRWSSPLTLEVGQTAVIDPALEVGAVETVIEVIDSTPIITTAGAEIADVKDAQRIQQLPLNGRSIANLFNLTPGVEGGGSPRINGLKVGSVEMLLDGISLVDRFGGGIARVLPGVDTIEEFRIETVGSSARYARPATVALVTKSGTNQLHGRLFETHRNDGAGLRSRRRQDGNQASKLIRNELGGSAGGPVYLPSLYDGRNKSFWFFAYEAQRLRTTLFQQDRVPTLEMWNGDFSRVIDAANRQTHIYDPLTTDAQGVRTQFDNNLIPRIRLHPFYATMRSVSHLPTLPTNPFQDVNLRRDYGDNTDSNAITIKGDHRFSDRDSLTGRFTRTRLDRIRRGGVFGSPTDDIPNGFGTGRSEPRVFSMALTHTRVFSPTFFSELLLASHRSRHGSGTLADSTDWGAQLGLPNPFGVSGWPTLSAGTFGWDSDNRHNQHLTAYVIEPNLTRVKGKHSIKFGGKVRYEYNNVRELQQAQGSHSFGSGWTALYNPAADQAVSFTGVDLASMALGLPTSLSNQYNRGYFYFEQQEVGLYFHDSWKV